MFVCNICMREFKNKRSLTSHKNHHDPEYHLKSISGAISSQAKATDKSREMSIKTTNIKQKLYYDSPKSCKKCHNILDYNKRNNIFCNHTCSALFQERNLISEQTKQKISSTLKGKPSPFKGINMKTGKPIIINSCIICSKKCGRNKTCSTECKNKHISNALKKAVEEGRHKGNKYRSRINSSYMEKSFSDYLLVEFPNLVWEQEKSFKIYSENGEYLRTFFADFYFPSHNIIIELDGSQHKNQKEFDDNRDFLIEKNYGIKTIRISHKEYITKEKEFLVQKTLRHSSI